MPFDIQGARSAGASDSQIAEHLASTLGFDINSARQSGASDSQIAEFLSKNERPKTQTAPTTTPSGGFSMGEYTDLEYTPDEERANRRMAVQGIAGLATAPAYAVPYAGPAITGGILTAAGRGMDALEGVPSEKSLKRELGENVAGAYAFKGMEKVAAPIIEAASPYFHPIGNRISRVVRRGFEKGVRPTVVGKSNASQTAAYYDKAETAVKSIIDNKQALSFSDDVGNVVKGELPKNLKQFSEAIDQTKRSIFNKYDAIIKESGGDIAIPLEGISAELLEFSGGKVNKIFGESSSKYSADMADKFLGHSLTLQEAQDAISILNSRLNAFYKNPTVETSTNAAVDAMVANRLRLAVDKAVEGSGYQALKNQYGALRSIEKEVSQRALVDARKNIKGLLDFTDIFTAAEAARAIATMNPASGLWAASARGFKELYKHINNPNRIVGSMFKDAEKLIIGSQRALGRK